MNIVLASKQIIPTTNNALIVGNSLGYDLTLSHGKMYNLSSKTLVEGLRTCAKLTIWAGKNKFEARTAPELEPINAINQKISEIVENLRGKLRNTFDEVHAFITGGVEYNPKNPVSQQSLDLLNEMYESLQKEGVPTTVIAAQRGDGLKTRINSMSYKNKIFVYGKPIDDVINSKKSSIQDALDDAFDFVELSATPIQIAK